MEYTSLEETLQFQDFVTRALFYNLGWSINILASRKSNIEIGESLAGVEIKNDKKMAETGNIYIELEEKACTGNFVTSGINRHDNTLIWAIGDYKKLYIFVKKHLKFLCDNYQRFNFKRVETETSKGILIPIIFLEQHDNYYITKLEF